MGSVVLNKNIINTYVMNDFEEYFKHIENAHSTATKVKNTTPSNFGYISYINNLTNEIDNLETSVENVQNLIISKLQQSDNTERKISEKTNEITNALAKLTSGASVAATGAVSSTKSTNKITENPQTGAHISKSTTIESGIKNFFGNIAEGAKSIGSKISKGYNTAKNWISEKTEVTTDWISSGINNIKENVTSAMKKTGAKIASAVSTAKEVVNKVGNVIKKVAASITNFAISLVKGIVGLVEALVDLVFLIGSVAATSTTGIYDIISGIFTGKWDWSNTKQLWQETKAIVSYQWTNKLADAFYNTSAGKDLDKWAYKPFKSDGIACNIGEGIGYIAGIIVLTIVTLGAGTAATGAAAGAGAATSAATATTAATTTSFFTTQSLVAGGITAAAGTGKNTSAAWNDGAGTVEGLLYGVAKGSYEGLEMAVGYGINGLQVVKGAGVAAKAANAATHVALDSVDGASGALVDPLFSMIYSPNKKNQEEIMKYVNYDSSGNKINDKTWDDLTFGEKYNALFQYKGGWTTVATQAAMAGGMSLLSEIPDISAAALSSKITKNINTKSLAEIKKTSDSIEINASNLIIDTQKIDEMINTITKTTDEWGSSYFDKKTMELFKNANATEMVEILNKLSDNSIAIEYISKGLSFNKLVEVIEKIYDTSNAKKIISNLRQDTVLELFQYYFVNNLTLEKFVRNFDNESLNYLINHLDNKKLTEPLNKILLYIDHDIIRYDSNYSDTLKSAIINNINLKHERFFDQYKINDSSYGVDQEATKKYVKYLVKEQWIDDFDNFVKFLKEKYSLPEADAIKHATRANTPGEKINIFFNNVIKEYMADRIDDSNLSIIKSISFERQEDQIYKELKNKLITLGLNEYDATRTLDCINTNGVCSYAAVANALIDKYKNIPDLFERDFGFPLYKEIDNHKTLNSSELITDMYLYMNSDACGSTLFKYNEGKFSVNELDDSNRIGLSGFYQTRDDIINMYLHSKNKKINFETISESYHTDTNSLFEVEQPLSIEELKNKIANSLQQGDSLGLGLYKIKDKKYDFFVDGQISESTNTWNEGNAHAVYITGMTEDSVIVSSWGKKCLIKFDDFIDNKYVFRKYIIGGIE